MTNVGFISDLLNIAKHDFVDKKLFETLIQTISSMLRKYVGQSNDEEVCIMNWNFHRYNNIY